MAMEYLNELATAVFPSVSEDDKERLSREFPDAVWTHGGPKEKKWEEMAFVVFVKDEGPCDPHNNGDHSDCDEDECKVEVYPL
jgi:hypothetical protein